MAWSTFPTSFGTCAIAWEGAAITGFFLPDSGLRLPDSPPEPELPVWISVIVVRVQRHLTGTRQDFHRLLRKLFHSLGWRSDASRHPGGEIGIEIGMADTAFRSGADPGKIDTQRPGAGANGGGGKDLCAARR